MIVLKILVGFALFIGMMVLSIFVSALFVLTSKKIAERITNKKVIKIGKSFSKMSSKLGNAMLILLLITMVVLMSFSIGDKIL